MLVNIKRVYELVDSDLGYRILVDRIWPRGIRKAHLKLDEWLREISPSNHLRKWFGHDISKWDEFKRKYREELLNQEDQIERIGNLCKSRCVLLLYSAKDKCHNQAIVLKD